MLSGILQLLFNAADIVIVGKFSGSHALAAVGSTSALINLFVNVFIGFSIGTNVLAAQYFGAKDRKNMQETVHTSVLLGIHCGAVINDFFVLHCLRDRTNCVIVVTVQQICAFTARYEKNIE